MGDVIELSIRENKAKYASPESILKEALELIKDEDNWKHFNKMLIIPVQIEQGVFDSSYLNAGLPAAQMLSVAAVLNAGALKIMRIIPED